MENSKMLLNVLKRNFLKKQLNYIPVKPSVSKFGYLLLALSLLIVAGCNEEDFVSDTNSQAEGRGAVGSTFVGSVYAMSNKLDENTIVAYGRNEDGTLSLIGEFPTGGIGGDFDGPEGLDPLISAYSLTKTQDNQYLLAANAGSNSITAFKINGDYSLTVSDIIGTNGTGPNSIAVRDRIVYVSNIDEDGNFNGEPDQEGSLTGFVLNRSGRFLPISRSNRSLGNRPSAVQFSPDGNFLVVASINAGSSTLASGSTDEIVVYAVNRGGILSDWPVSAATSTLPDNAEGRNLPSAIGFQIVGDNYVVVTEAREFQPNGTPPAFPLLQTGSVSTWQIQSDGSLTPINLDVLSGDGSSQGRTACWLDFSNDGSYFWVSNAIEAGLAAYSFNSGQIELINATAAQGTGAGDTTDPGSAFATTDGWIDLWVSDDGKYLYQLFGLDGTIGVFEINGSSLSFVEEVSGDLPVENTQGIVAI